jgi:hypothetical protein
MTAISGSRRMKKDIEELILDSFTAGPDLFADYPAKKAVNVLISFFCSLNPLLRWRSVTCTGGLVAGMAEENIEDARIIMRRFMWMLNEESGGIGWGAPEAMGEIMARSPRLAEEYHRILISYLDEGGNYLDHEPIQDGVLWGILRLAESSPTLLVSAPPLIRPFLTSPSPVKRGLACTISGLLEDSHSRDILEQLILDKTVIKLYKDSDIRDYVVGNLARNAFDRLP